MRWRQILTWSVQPRTKPPPPLRVYFAAGIRRHGHPSRQAPLLPDSEPHGVGRSELKAALDNTVPAVRRGAELK
jgi:hypothetical protein